MAITAEAVKDLASAPARHDGLQAGARRDRRDVEKAVAILRERASRLPRRRPAAMPARASVSSYIHTGGRVGVLLEVNCETDFVARTTSPEALRDIAMQIAASRRPT